MHSRPIVPLNRFLERAVSPARPKPFRSCLNGYTLLNGHTWPKPTR